MAAAAARQVLLSDFDSVQRDAFRFFVSQIPGRLGICHGRVSGYRERLGS